MYSKRMKSVLLTMLTVSIMALSWAAAQEMQPIIAHSLMTVQQTQDIARILAASYPEAQPPAGFYIGAEICLLCHSSRHPGTMDWLDTKHAYFIRKPMGMYSLRAGKGVMADSLGGSVDDFMMGLDFNKLADTPFDSLKPDAPILSYDSASDKYFIQLGPKGLKLWVVATLGGHSVGNGQRYMVRIPVSDTPSKWSNANYFGPVAWSGTAWTSNASNWYTGAVPIYSVGTASSSLGPLQGQNYLKNCAGCHITGLKKAYVSRSGEYIVNPYSAIMMPLESPNYPDLDGDGNPDLANIGCESCHGPGSNHVGDPKNPSKIVNPADITSNRLRSNVCLQCHTQVASAPAKRWGFTYDDQNDKPYIVTNPPQSLDSYQVFTGGKWPDGWNYTYARIDSYKSSAHFSGSHGIACNDCHNSHAETGNTAQVRDKITRSGVNDIPGSIENNSFCLACHAGYGEFSRLSKGMIKAWKDNLPLIREVVEEHSHHPEGAERSFGLSRCTTCHMAPTAGRGVIAGVTHTFAPARPEDTIAFQKSSSTGSSYNATGNVNSCSSSCHRGKAIVWSDVPANITPNDNKFGTDKENSLAKHLVKYYGPEGIWWNTKK